MISKQLKDYFFQLYWSTFFQEEQSRGWNIGLGKALLAVKQGNNETFVEQIKLLRALQMGPLSAASMEMGSYFRGYDYIIRLVICPFPAGW